MIEFKQNDLKMTKIEGEIIFEKAKAEIDTQFLAAFEEASLNPMLYTKDYLGYLAGEAFTSNATIYLGDQIPDAMIQQRKFQKI